ncbi:MAG: O-antigen ligase family protein [Rhodospirillales bacterium]|nr:O-antigen ligase family protein [Rhodospirillales bacterium]
MLLAAIFCAFAALLPVVCVVAPKGTVVLLLLAAVMAIPTYWWMHRRFPIPDLRISIVLALLVVWCAIASGWSDDPTRSLLLTLRVAVLFAAGMALFPVVAALNEVAKNYICLWLIAGSALSLVLMVVEMGLGYPTVHTFKELSEGREAIAFNRGAIALSMITWPVVAFLWNRGIGWKALAIPVVLGTLSVFLESAAATLGFLVGVASVLIIVCQRKMGRLTTLAACVVAFIALPFAMREMHKYEWHRADWLSQSEQHRVEIWNFSLERIAEKPVFGWGFDESRHIAKLFFGADESSRSMVPLHPHNGPLQILLELGSVGAVIALALLWLIAHQLERLPGRARECSQALFVASLAVGCVAFGQWQNWWIALIFSVALLVPLTATPSTGVGANRIQ